MIIEESLVNPQADEKDLIRLPAIKIAEELGNKLAANIVMLGYLIGATKAVTFTAMEEAIRATVNERHLEVDMRALNAGFRLAAEAGND